MNTPTHSDNTPHPSFPEIDAVRSGEAAAAIESHIRGCPQCAAALAQFQVIADQAQAVRTDEYPEAAAADEAVLAAIDRRANEIRWLRRGRRVLVHPAWAAAAAVVLISLSVLIFSPVRDLLGRRAEIASAIDMDRDGTTDIVDAYLLAMALQGGRPPANSWDLTGDAVVDGADVRAVARMAVSVGRSST